MGEHARHPDSGCRCLVRGQACLIWESLSRFPAIAFFSPPETPDDLRLPTSDLRPCFQPVCRCQADTPLKHLGLPYFTGWMTGPHASPPETSGTLSRQHFWPGSFWRRQPPRLSWTVGSRRSEVGSRYFRNKSRFFRAASDALSTPWESLMRTASSRTEIASACRPVTSNSTASLFLAQ
jgi:hypothetical protein